MDGARLDRLCRMQREMILVLFELLESDYEPLTSLRLPRTLAQATVLSPVGESSRQSQVAYFSQGDSTSEISARFFGSLRRTRTRRPVTTSSVGTWLTRRRSATSGR